MPEREEKGTASRFGYVPELDGLRGIAIIVVVGFHAGVPGFRNGGYLGVDLFFVLSGYLITSVILKEIETTGRFDPFAFYARRWLRLSPALLLVCTALFLAAPLLANPSQVVPDVVATLGYIANWTRAVGDGSPMYLGHTWSLSVEEQFYLLWPALLLGALRWFGRTGALASAVAFASASCAWRAILYFNGATIDRIYNGTDTRLDALFVGCALALILSFRSKTDANDGRRAPRLLVWTAICVLFAIYCFAPYTAPAMAYGGYTVVALCSTVLICACIGSGWRTLKAALRFPPLVYTGKISYSLYVWHYPLIVILMVGWAPVPAWILWCSIPVAVGLSVLSYHLVEKRALRWRHTMSQRWLSLAGAVALAISIIFMTLSALFFFG